jgi:hypothetical protein
MECLATGLQSLRYMNIHLIAVEVCIKRCANTLIESQRVTGRNFNSESHHTYSMKAGLSIKYYDIVVPQMSFYYISDLQYNLTESNCCSTTIGSYYKVRSTEFASVLNARSKKLNGSFSHWNTYSQDFGHMCWNYHLSGM